MKPPAKVFPPSEFIADELMERKWSCAEFAEKLGWPPSWAHLLLSGMVKITPPLASDLARIFGTTQEFWLNLQRVYERHTARRTRRPKVKV